MSRLVNWCLQSFVTQVLFHPMDDNFWHCMKYCKTNMVPLSLAELSLYACTYVHVQQSFVNQFLFYLMDDNF